MKNWAVALSGSLVRAMARVPRWFDRPLPASFLIGCLVSFSRMLGLSRPPAISIRTPAAVPLPDRTPMRAIATAGLVVLLLAAAAAAQYDPPPAKTPDKETLAAIAERTARLGNGLTTLQRQGVRDPVLADIEVYHKAAEWTSRHNEFYSDH